MLGVTSAETLTAIYDAARYDDDRPSSPASRCPTPGRWPARSTPAADVRRTSRWGRATADGFMLVDGEPGGEKTCRDCEYYQP